MITPDTMTVRAPFRRRLSLLPLAAALAVVLGAPLLAQPQKEPLEERAFELAPFSVSATAANRYQPADSISATRVRTALADVPQSISVVNAELLRDVGALRFIEAAKYVTPILESNLPNTIDRRTIRGFQTQFRVVDGLFSQSPGPVDSAMIDRIEIVKGPNAVLAPSGDAGGTTSIVTKSPLFTARGELRLQVGEFEQNRIEADVTGPIAGSRNLAFRLVGVVQDSEGYVDDNRTRAWHVFPSFTWRPSASTELTVKAQFTDWNMDYHVGLPVDPSVGPGDRARIFGGMPDTFNFNRGGGPERTDRHQSISASLQTEFSEQVAARLLVRAMHVEESEFSVQGVNLSGDAGARDPRTGRWTPGFVYGPAPDYVATPVTFGTVFRRTGNLDERKRYFVNLRNDYAVTWENDGLKSVTLLGLAANYNLLDSWMVRPVTYDNLDLANPAATANTIAISSTPSRNSSSAITDAQVFVNERLHLLSDRLILSGGVSRFWFKGERLDNPLLPAVTGTNTPTVTGSQTSYSAGIVAKPLPGVSAFYGYNENTKAPDVEAVGTVSNATLRQTGRQHEFGLKVSLLEGRATAQAVYFDIAQTNFAFPNPARATDPLAPPFAFSDLTSKGWELEFAVQALDELTIVGNVTNFRIRDPLGIRQRSAADTAWALLVRYDYRRFGWRGLSTFVGVDYLGERPGDATSGFTAASTAGNVIVNQPSFYLQARTIANVGIGYETDRWTAALRINNVLDEDYIEASLGRNLLFVGKPRNFGATFTYRF